MQIGHIQKTQGVRLYAAGHGCVAPEALEFGIGRTAAAQVLRGRIPEPGCRHPWRTSGLDTQTEPIETTSKRFPRTRGGH